MQINKNKDGKETVDIGGVAESRSQRWACLLMEVCASRKERNYSTERFN